MSKRVRPCCTASLKASTGHEHAFGAVPHVIQRACLGAARATFPVLRSMGHFRLEQYTQCGFHTCFFLFSSKCACVYMYCFVLSNFPFPCLGADWYIYPEQRLSTQKYAYPCMSNLFMRFFASICAVERAHAGGEPAARGWPASAVNFERVKACTSSAFLIFFHVPLTFFLILTP